MCLEGTQLQHFSKYSNSLPWVCVARLKLQLTQSAIVDSVLLFAADCKVLHLSVFDFLRHSQTGMFELYFSMSLCGYWSKWTLPICVTVYSHFPRFFSLLSCWLFPLCYTHCFLPSVPPSSILPALLRVWWIAVLFGWSRAWKLPFCVI